MAYISTERVTEIRNELKKEFPTKNGWKLSITRKHYSTVQVSIMSAPLNMMEGEERDYAQVNQFYIQEHYAEKPHVKDVLQKIQDIINNGNRIISVDGDYGNIPAFYTSLNIGEWDKAFKQSQA